MDPRVYTFTVTEVLINWSDCSLVCGQFVPRMSEKQVHTQKPSIHFLYTLNPSQGRGGVGGLEPVPTVIGQEDTSWTGYSSSQTQKPVKTTIMRIFPEQT